MKGAFRSQTRGVWWAIYGVLTLAVGDVPGLAQHVELVSRATPSLFTDTAGGDSAPSALSADGRYVVFVSKAPNLVPGQVDPNGGDDVFLWDRIAGTTVLVSRSASSAARAGNAAAGSPSLSVDGRYVVFHSQATDLVPSQIDDNDSEDVFLYDRVTGTTQLVSHAAGAADTAGNYLSRNPLISADGRYIAFNSFSSDLVDGLTLNALSVFLYDREAGVLSLVSHRHDSPLTGASALAHVLDISADGSFLAFSSSGTDLVAGQTSTSSTFGTTHTFLYDRAADTHTLVSHASGSPAAGANENSSSVARLSADGRYLAFMSTASNLLAGQVKLDYSVWDAFLYDRVTGGTVLVSRSASSPLQGADHFLSISLDLSEDGAFVTFVAEASNLVSGYSSPGVSSASNVFLYDRAAGTVTLVSHASTSANTSSSGHSGSPSLSADGRYIAFQSTADDLLPGSVDDGFFGGTSDVFLYDRLTATSSLVSRKHGAAPGNPCNDSSEAPVLSAGGGFVAFASDATDLTGARDTNSAADVILHDRATAGAMLVSRRAADLPALSADSYSTSFSFAPVSADGRWITFESFGGNLVPGQIENNHPDIFLYDRSTGTTTLVSRSTSSPLAGGNDSSSQSVVSADGRYVTFYSYATNLVPGLFTVETGQIFLFDRISGTTTLVSRSASAPNWTANQSCAISRISADGRFVAYLCSATDLVPGQDDVNADVSDINGSDDVFLFDRAAGTTTLVSRSAASPFQTGNYRSLDFDLSSDGRYVAFRSLATDLVPGVDDGNGDADVFLFDRVAETTTLVSRSSATPGHTGNGYSGPPVLSNDGRYAAFWSTSTDLVPGHATTPSASGNVFLYDRVTGTTVLVSHAPGSPTTSPNGSSGETLISGDGRWVAFLSYATDLVPGQVDFPGYQDLFLFDRVTGTVRLVNHTSGSLVTPCQSTETRATSLSADGRYLVFTSYCQDFVPGQQNAALGLNIFLYDRQTEQIALMDHETESTARTGNSYAWGSWISADGGTVVFTSPAADLVDGDFNNAPDVFAYLNPLPGRAFHTLNPCRVLDTRQPQDGPALVSGVPEVLSLHGVCGIPATARAVSVNVTIVQPTGAGHLGFSPGDLGDPESSTINFGPGQVRANNAILPLAVNGLGTLRVSPFVAGNGTVHLILDINGWFE